MVFTILPKMAMAALFFCSVVSCLPSPQSLAGSTSPLRVKRENKGEEFQRRLVVNNDKAAMRTMIEDSYVLGGSKGSSATMMQTDGSDSQPLPAGEQAMEMENQGMSMGDQGMAEPAAGDLDMMEQMAPEMKMLARALLGGGSDENNADYDDQGDDRAVGRSLMFDPLAMHVHSLMRSLNIPGGDPLQQGLGLSQPAGPIDHSVTGPALTAGGIHQGSHKKRLHSNRGSSDSSGSSENGSKNRKDGRNASGMSRKIGTSSDIMDILSSLFSRSEERSGREETQARDVVGAQDLLGMLSGSQGSHMMDKGHNKGNNMPMTVIVAQPGQLKGLQRMLMLGADSDGMEELLGRK